MKVLVSGSSGLIGTALRAVLAEGGHDVVRLVRGGPDAAPARGGEQRVAWDPAAGRLDLAPVGAPDAIINLSGAGIGDHRWSDAYRAELLRSRLDATRLLAHAAAALEPRPRTFLSGSAVGYYGDRGDEELTEDSSAGRGYLADMCVAWEAATAEAAEAGVGVAHLRSGVVLTPEGGALRKQLPLFRLGLGGRLGRGRQWLAWISLDDEVRAIVHALETGMTGALNLTAPAPVTNAEFTRRLAAALHRPAVAAVPRFALGVALGSQMADEMVLASQRALPARLLASGFRFDDGDLAGALARAFP